MKFVNLIKAEFIKNYSVKKSYIVLITLLATIIGMMELEAKLSKPRLYNIQNEIEEYTKFLEHELDTYHSPFLNEYETYRNETKLKILKEFANEKIYSNSWKDYLLFQIETIEDKIFIINQMVENYGNSFFTDIGVSDAHQFDFYEGTVREYYGKTKEELVREIENLKEQATNYRAFLKQNQYYKYLEYQIKHDKNFDVDGEYQFLVDKKIENMFDSLSLNQLEMHVGIGINGEYYTAAIKEVDRKADLILHYSFWNDKKHDFSFPEGTVDSYLVYPTAKTVTNKIVLLSLLVLLIVIFTSGGVIVNEHIHKTEKMLFTTPYKRWKILFGKFVYLILDMFMIWFLAFVILLFYAGIKYGFGELLTAKLIVEGDQVAEVNYLFYLLKEILLCSIPMISFLSCFCFISVVTLSKTVTIGFSIILLLVSQFMWFLIVTFKLGFLIYTPFPYFILGLILRNHSYYLLAQSIGTTSASYGILISILTIIACCGMSYIIYTKRDIGN